MMSIRKYALALCVGMVVAGAGGLLAQEPGADAKGGVAVRRVPSNFGKLGLPILHDNNTSSYLYR